MRKPNPTGASAGSVSPNDAVSAIAALTANLQELLGAIKTLTTALHPESKQSTAVHEPYRQNSSAEGEIVGVGAASGTVAETGIDSPILARVKARLRAAEQSGFRDETIEEFDIPSAILQGEIERSHLGSSSASGLYALEEQRKNLDEQERKRLLQRRAERMVQPDFTAAENLDLVRQIEHLSTDEARANRDEAKGLEDVLPALSANRPAGYSHYSTEDLAHMRHPNGTDHHASTTNDVEMQEHWMQASHCNHSTDDNSTRLAEAIGRLTEAILNGGTRAGVMQHPGEASGALHGLLQTSTIKPRPDGYN